MANPQQTTFHIPLTWDQWRLGRPNTYAEFQAYGRSVLAEQHALYTQVRSTQAQRNTVQGLQAVLRGLITPPAVVPAAGAPPTAAMVTAADNLLAGLVTVINAGLADNAAHEAAQSKWSPLNKSVVKQRTDADLILASSGGIVGWQPAWANAPIPVDINAPEVNEEIRVLCAFILCSDTVVGVVIPADEAAGTPLPADEHMFASALNADTRPPNLRRTVECQNYGVMRSWHIDLPGYFAGHRTPPIASARGAAYLALNLAEFNADQGIAIAVDQVANQPGRPALKQHGHLVPQGLTEFNMLFGTNGRLIFDYEAGDFYLSGHYQAYPVPDQVLTQPERLANEATRAQKQPGLTCYPYFKLTNLHQIRLSWAGYIELGRLRYWENQRRARHRGTIGQ